MLRFKLESSKINWEEGVKVRGLHVSGYFLSFVELGEFIVMCSVCLVPVALFSRRTSGSM